MKRRLLAGAVVLTIVSGASAGLIHWWRQAPVVVGTEAQAVLQIPRELQTQIALFDRKAADNKSDCVLSNGLADETLVRLHERNLSLQLDRPESSPRECLVARTQVRLESEAGQDRVTLTYRTAVAEEAVPVLTALVDTLREVQPPSSKQGEAAELAEKESQLAGRLKRLEAAVAQQKQAIQAAGLSESERVVLLEQMKSLGVDLAEARRDRLEAEHRLLQTRKDLETGLPVDVLISRLPGNESQESLRKLLSRPRVQEELKVEQASYRQLANVYGRKHPRMVELTRKIELLEAQSKSLIVQASAETGSDSTAGVLVRLLAADLEERQALEVDLQEQFDVRKGSLDEQAGRIASVEQLQKESVRLQEEREAVRRKIVEARQRWQEHATEVLEPAGIVEMSGEGRSWLRGAGSAIAGAVLLGALAIVWRRQPGKSDGTRSTKRTISALNPLREKEERAARLARLKNLGRGRPLTPHGPLLPQST